MYKKLLALVASGERNSVLRDWSRRETSSMSFHAFEFEQCESISYSKNQIYTIETIRKAIRVHIKIR